MMNSVNTPVQFGLSFKSVIDKVRGKEQQDTDAVEEQVLDVAEAPSIYQSNLDDLAAGVKHAFNQQISDLVADGNTVEFSRGLMPGLRDLRSASQLKHCIDKSREFLVENEARPLFVAFNTATSRQAEDLADRLNQFLETYNKKLEADDATLTTTASARVLPNNKTIVYWAAEKKVLEIVENDEKPEAADAKSLDADEPQDV